MTPVNRRTVSCFAGVAFLVSAWSADYHISAQASDLSGAATFRLYCASCHGTSGKGDGPLASSMKTPPADLTQITKRNRGVFPADQILRTIDGRSPARGHGSDMPVWGDAFAASKLDSAPASQRMQRLVSFLESIQAQP
jgi:mono/diheme cytochrome c family protein